jgi:hypothetical protein
MAAMKPEPLALTSFGSRIGSPAMNGARAIEPENLGRCIRAIVAADKAVARSRRRPRLPLQSVGGHSLAKTDVGLGNENVHGLQRDRFGGGRPVAQPTREIGGNAAGKESDGQDDDACGILSTFTRLNYMWVQLLL